MAKDMTNVGTGLRLLRSIDTRNDIEKQAEFLGSFITTHNLKAACADAQITYSTVLGWRKLDQAFKDAYEEIVRDFCAELEAECYRRAVKGIERPIYQKGELVGTEIVYSDDLLKFLMKANMPEKYREKLTIEKNKTTTNTVLVMPSNGRELQIPQGVDEGYLPKMPVPDVRNYIPSEDLMQDDIAREENYQEDNLNNE